MANFSYQDVLDFWFAEGMQPKWYMKDMEFDEEIRHKFMSHYHFAMEGAYDEWTKSPEGALALVILLDQFPRNMFRGTEKAFSSDSRALQIAKKAIDHKMNQKLVSREHRHFLYMPFMHSESLEDQEKCVDLFKSIPEGYDYAIQHRDIIARFGRFPHRNDILERASTPEEKDFLQEEGSSF